MIYVNCRAVDGRLDTVLAGHFGCARTGNLVPNAWWVVDLGIPRLITHVMITSREFIGLSCYKPQVLSLGLVIWYNWIRNKARTFVSYMSLFIYGKLACNITASEGRIWWSGRRRNSKVPGLLYSLCAIRFIVGAVFELAWAGLNSSGHFQGCLLSSFPWKVRLWWTLRRSALV